MTVSVVIPAFNVASHIEQCINSVLISGPKESEILIINDGSTDDTAETCRTFTNPSSSVRIINKQNGGCASARSLGLQIAQKRFICFLDADDWIEPAYFTDLLNACSSKSAPMANCFYTSRFETEGSQSPGYPYSFLKGQFRGLGYEIIPAIETLLWKPTIWASLFEREFLLRKRIEFPEHIRMFDDLAFHAQIAFSGANIAIVPKHLYNYRLQRPGQDVSNRGEKLFVHFDIFDYLETKLADEAKRSVDYFLLKYQTHRWTLASIDEELRQAYRAKAAIDLFHGRPRHEALRAISELGKIKRRYGRDALSLLALYEWRRLNRRSSISSFISR